MRATVAFGGQGGSPKRWILVVPAVSDSSVGTKLDSIRRVWIIGVYPVGSFGWIRETGKSVRRTQRLMWEYLTSPVAQGIYWLAAAIILSLAGWSYVTGWRDENVSGDGTDVMSNMRDLRRQGLLDEDEFRTIKSSIGNQPRKRT